MYTESIVVIVAMVGVAASGLALFMSNRREAERDAHQVLRDTFDSHEARLAGQIRANARMQQEKENLERGLHEHFSRTPTRTHDSDSTRPPSSGSVNATYYEQSYETPPEPEPSKFRQHKLACDSCDSPLSVQANQLAVCDFCGARYFLEGYEAVRQAETWTPDEWEPAEPYHLERGVTFHQKAEGDGWVDGGVSIRDVLPSPYAPWLTGE